MTKPTAEQQEMFDEAVMLGVSMAYHVADSTGLRVMQNKGKQPSLAGKITWMAPWGSPLQMVKNSICRVDANGFAHVLLFCPGDLRLYMHLTDAEDTILVIDASLGDAALPNDLSITSVAAAFQSNAVALFKRVCEKDGGPWIKVK